MFWVPLAAWMGLIFWFSSRPDLPHAPGAFVDFVLKKSLHATAYGVLAWLWLRALADLGVRSAEAWAVGLAIAYAVSDEWHQTLVPGRTGRVLDVLIDAAGALAALAIARALDR